MKSIWDSTSKTRTSCLIYSVGSNFAFFLFLFPNIPKEKLKGR